MWLQWKHWRDGVQESLPWGAPPAQCLGSLGTPRGCNGSPPSLTSGYRNHLPRTILTQIYSANAKDVQRLSPSESEITVQCTLDLHFTLIWPQIPLTFLERLFPMTHCHAAFPQRQPPCSPLWPALVYLPSTDPNSFNFTLLLLLFTFLRREIYRESSGEVAKHPAACPH